MKTFSLYFHHEDLEPIKKCQAMNHRKAADFFRSYVKTNLDRKSLHGFTIKRDDLQVMRVENDLYIELKVFERMKEGSEGLGYINVDDKKQYVKVDSAAFQPAIRVNDNTFKVTFIMK